jgi:hypothetical protein
MEKEIDDKYTAVNFINILRRRFLYKMLAPKIIKLRKAKNMFSFEKCVGKMLMKLIPAWIVSFKC